MWISDAGWSKSIINFLWLSIKFTAKIRLMPKNSARRLTKTAEVSIYKHLLNLTHTRAIVSKHIVTWQQKQGASEHQYWNNGAIEWLYHWYLTTRAKLVRDEQSLKIWHKRYDTTRSQVKVNNICPCQIFQILILAPHTQIISDLNFTLFSTHNFNDLLMPKH